MSSRSLLRQLRVQVGRALTDAGWALLASATRRLPDARPERHGVERIDDVPYLPGGGEHHRLDVYRPRAGVERRGLLPVVLYLHGGGFRVLSKETHWIMALAFARRGYVVFNVDYRLAPAHPFPAAVEDGCSALAWVAENAARFGGDAGRLVIAGESAGANLATSIALTTAWPRPEPFARKVWATGVRPRAVLPACGILQVSDVARFARRKRLNAYLRDRLHEVEDAYLPPHVHPRGEPRDLADPLLWLERAAPPERPLAPFFAGVGTADVLLDDTRRLKAALDRLEVPCRVKYYPGEIHAFHALVWRRAAREFWRDTFEFLQEHVPG
jgi:acetyl esterase